VRNERNSFTWAELATRCVAGEPASGAEALAVLAADDDDLLDLVAAAWRVRRHHFGREVTLQVLLNADPSPCSEDCAFCGQSGRGRSGERPAPSGEATVAAAQRARDAGARRFCMVGTGRGPTEHRLDQVCAAIHEVRREVGIPVCVSMGLLLPGQADRLRAAGADRYNHNLETGPRHFPSICTTHTFEERVSTIERAREAGLEVCSGGIVGIGESDEDLVEMALLLRALGVSSIPINALDPRPGTPLAGQSRPDPRRVLKVLCMVRLVAPDRDLRIAAGREVVLRSLQPLALYVCNSMFTGGYLTTGGNEPDRDLRLLDDLGLVAAEGVDGEH